MAKEFAQEFYHSKKWKECRKSYIAQRVEVDGGMCEICRKELGYIVHHKTALTPQNINNPDITLNHCKLEYVCKRCHDDLDGHGLNKPKESICFFDERGQPAKKPKSPP